VPLFAPCGGVVLVILSNTPTSINYDIKYKISSSFRQDVGYNVGVCNLKGRNTTMSLGALEGTLAKWKRELSESPDRTVLKQKDIDQLLKKIDKVYSMESATHLYIEEVQKFIDKDRGF
jgi:hypothetical protein